MTPSQRQQEADTLYTYYELQSNLILCWQVIMNFGISRFFWKLVRILFKLESYRFDTCKTENLSTHSDSDSVDKWLWILDFHDFFGKLIWKLFKLEAYASPPSAKWSDFLLTSDLWELSTKEFKQIKIYHGSSSKFVELLFHKKTDKPSISFGNSSIFEHTGLAKVGH